MKKHRKRQVFVYFNPRPSREGRPAALAFTVAFVPHFNPRPSREGRLHLKIQPKEDFLFQSTPLAGGATEGDGVKSYYHADFNPRPSREGRQIAAFKRLLFA